MKSLLKDNLQKQGSTPPNKLDSRPYYQHFQGRESDELILQKLNSDYRLENLVCTADAKEKLKNFLEEHRNLDILEKYQLPISNKLFLYGPSGCGKTLASYVIAGELDKTMIVVNLGAIVSSKLGETSKNLTQIFKKAVLDNCIIFIDEFDSLGKVCNYNQDHGEMKRVVNTILQLLDYLPQSSLVICATNQKEMLDSAILRRFDFAISLESPGEKQIQELIQLVLKEGKFTLDRQVPIKSLIEAAQGLSYYSVQKTLINAIKNSFFDMESKNIKKPVINTAIWSKLLNQEKEFLNKVNEDFILA